MFGCWDRNVIEIYKEAEIEIDRNGRLKSIWNDKTIQQIWPDGDLDIWLQKLYCFRMTTYRVETRQSLIWVATSNPSFTPGGLVVEKYTTWLKTELDEIISQQALGYIYDNIWHPTKDCKGFSIWRGQPCLLDSDDCSNKTSAYGRSIQLIIDCQVEKHKHWMIKTE